MPPSFGTSGLRGLVTELTDDLVNDMVRAYLAACAHGGAVMVGWDLRASSPGIAATVLEALRAAGVQPICAGAVPTPALALATTTRGCGAVMVTGSHIPADRNGLKFYTVTGEISKQDEQAILAAAGQNWPFSDPLPQVIDAPETAPAYVARYLSAYGPQALAGLRIGVYQHSSVARDLMMDVFAGLGAAPVALARADHFIPVDTEAVAPETRAQLAEWCDQHQLDALVSTDGDADRPLLCDAQGQVVPGDVLGVLTARALGAGVICTPVSSNSMVDLLPDFKVVTRTRIGSPHVIAAMDAALAADPAAKVVGYEANGGFLLGFAADGPAGPLPPLMTRDCLLPVIAPLAAAHAAGQGIASMLAGLPARFTAADRVQQVPAEASGAFIASLQADAKARASFFETGHPEVDLDMTDGLRVAFAGGQIVHLRPSGNAPECRCYAEAATRQEAEYLVRHHLQKLRAVLTEGGNT
ncbi:phosphomannomutase [Roseinatronobacter sp. S2]|uniref:phosphomannomutase n=1 Tax=Roseinatronobacter sp. S2 TaxID=3035471 RepID=UPI002410713C|nr:phosphomannomutase [Roseinatronobacter sp. S2]WFE75351.1 phosphomannomutase [Roseinatronobacter sp. S2]